MSKYTQIKYYDMVKIETLLDEGLNISDIAVKIGKHKTTVYRFIKKNSHEGKFIADKAWHKLYERKNRSNSHPRILSDSLLEKYVLEKIESYWSPEQVVGAWKKGKKEPLSHETIYKYIYEKKPELVKIYFRRKGARYRNRRNEGVGKIPNMRNINERPDAVESRKEIGHWEGDTITDKGLIRGIVTNIERKSGFLIASKVNNRRSTDICDVTIEDFSILPDNLRLSITYDQGSEFSKHEIIENNTKMTVYFAHKGCPWERASNESTNGLLRQFIPKGTDLNKVTDEDLQHYVDLLNNRPRKRLKYQTPYEVFHKELASCS